MDEIGAKVTLQLVQEVSVEKEATKFEFLTLRIRPPDHKVEAEVALFDQAGNVIGGARWVQINPLPASYPDGDLVDNWAAVLDTKLAGLNEMVRQQLKELT